MDPPNASGPMLALPRFGNRSSLREVVHHEDELMGMIAVLDFDIDPGLGHPPRDLAELTGRALMLALHEDIPLREDADAGRLERPAGRGSIREEEVGDTDAVDDEGASALDAHAGAPQCFAHLGQRAGAILQRDG